ncbi:MAG: PAS domain-containing sensor histidine kinase [Ferruginibacter sp.]
MSVDLNPKFGSFNFFETLFKYTKQNRVILMDEKGFITEVNTAFTESFGYTRDDIVGKHISVLFTEEDIKKKLPKKEIAKVLADGQAFDNNFLVHKNKNLIWVSGESILVKNNEGKAAILKVIQNINQQKVSEESLFRLSVFNENILSSIEDIVIVLTKKLKIIKVNNAFYHLFSYSAEEVIKMDFYKLMRPHVVNNELFEKIQQVLDTKEGFTNHAFEIEVASGEKKVFDISCSTMEEAGTHKNILVVAHDITIQKQAEKEREDIIGFVAHELRNPLSNIVLCNEMMSQLINDNQHHEIADYLQRSKNNVMRLNKMIGELYDATKFNAGHFRLEKSVFDFEQMIEEALDTIEVLQPDYTIQVEGECPVPVYGDRYRLIQVVTNYLSNGIKYSNGHTIVTIRMRLENNNVTVSVKDYGLGIAPQHLPHIFSRFFRTEKTKNLEGIGLGLYLCRRIIEAHDGKVWAESEEGKGSTFFFSIPVQ